MLAADRAEAAVLPAISATRNEKSPAMSRAFCCGQLARDLAENGRLARTLLGLRQYLILRCELVIDETPHSVRGAADRRARFRTCRFRT